MTQEYDDLKRLRDAHVRRLRKRQEQAAQAGSLGDPSITIDIEDIEKEIKNISDQIAQLDGSLRKSPDDQLFCVNLWSYPLGQRSEMKSRSAQRCRLLDFTQYFDQDDNPSRLASEQEWASDILPKIRQCAIDTTQEREIAGYIHATPAMGVAFGAAFAGSPKIIWVDQGKGGNIDWWHSNAAAGSIDVPIPTISDTGNGTDTIIDVCAVPPQRESTKQQVTAAVEARNIAYDKRISIGYDITEDIRGPGHAMAIAKVVGQEIRKARSGSVHLFLSVPVALSVFIGLQLNACPPIQCYEYRKNKSSNDTPYVPAWFLP